MRDFFREHCLKKNLLQLSHSMFCKNVARLAVARGCHTWIGSLATAKRATFLQNILRKSCSKFDFKQCFKWKYLKILIFYREYMEMCFHGNQLSWGIKHSLISLWSNYHFPVFICFSTMLAPVISSLDEIYCTCLSMALANASLWASQNSVIRENQVWNLKILFIWVLSGICSSIRHSLW